MHRRRVVNGHSDFCERSSRKPVLARNLVLHILGDGRVLLLQESPPRTHVHGNVLVEEGAALLIQPRLELEGLLVLRGCLLLVGATYSGGAVQRVTLCVQVQGGQVWTAALVFVYLALYSTRILCSCGIVCASHSCCLANFARATRFAVGNARARMRRTLSALDLESK